MLRAFFWGRGEGKMLSQFFARGLLEADLWLRNDATVEAMHIVYRMFLAIFTLERNSNTELKACGKYVIAYC